MIWTWLKISDSQSLMPPPSPESTFDKS
jgi:hypothetical protein